MNVPVYKDVLRAPKLKGNKRLNVQVYQDYFARLMEFALNMFEWEGLPDTCSEPFLELNLCTQGVCAFFEDEVMGYLTLPISINGRLDVYGRPVRYRAYAANGYQRDLDRTNSVLIYNNYLRSPSTLTVALYAERLANLQRSIDVNVSAQKTPTVIVCGETQRLTMENLFAKVQDNETLVFGKRDLDLEGISTFNPRAEYVADRLETLKNEVWRECMNFFGVETTPSDKKERLNIPEVDVAMGSAQAQRFIWLNPRQEAARQIKEMFGVEIKPQYREITRTPGQSTELWEPLEEAEENG